jgi:tetratricopeptide (TPR) repeat protein
MNRKTVGMPALVIGAALVASACGTQLQVMVREPAPINLGVAKRLSVVQSEGRRSSKETVIGLLLKGARADGYFQIADRTEEGITLKAVDRRSEIAGGKRAQEPDEIYLRVDIQGWEASRDERRSTDSEGNEVVTKVVQGEVVLGVTIGHPSGRAVLAEKEYRGKSELDASKYEKDAAIEAAARNAVAALLGDITPQSVQASLKIDDDDEAQKPIIAVAKGGNLQRAAEEMQAYLGRNPSNVIAAYNYAVLLDAQGRYSEALEHYTKAASSTTKAYYTEGKAACARRLAAQEALSK